MTQKIKEDVERVMEVILSGKCDGLFLDEIALIQPTIDGDSVEMGPVIKNQYSPKEAEQLRIAIIKKIIAALKEDRSFMITGSLFLTLDLLTLRKEQQEAVSDILEAITKSSIKALICSHLVAPLTSYHATDTDSVLNDISLLDRL